MSKQAKLKAACPVAALHRPCVLLATMEPFEKTYAMIKPDALRAGKAEEICQLIEVHGFTIIAKQKLQVSAAFTDREQYCHVRSCIE